MDADNRVIHYTEDDQGEGVKDPLTVDDLIKAGFYDQQHEHQADLFRRLITDQFHAPKKVEMPRKSGREVECRWAPPKNFNRHR